MNCRDCRDRFSPLMDGEISSAELAATRAHFADCGDCCREWASLCCLEAELALVEAPGASDRLWDGIERRLDALALPDIREREDAPENVVDFFRARSRLSRAGRR
jgi:hypothetical protein